MTLFARIAKNEKANILENVLENVSAKIGHERHRRTDKIHRIQDTGPARR